MFEDFAYAVLDFSQMVGLSVIVLSVVYSALTLVSKGLGSKSKENKK